MFHLCRESGVVYGARRSRAEPAIMAARPAFVNCWVGRRQTRKASRRFHGFTQRGIQRPPGVPSGNPKSRDTEDTEKRPGTQRRPHARSARPCGEEREDLITEDTEGKTEDTEKVVLSGHGAGRAPKGITTFVSFDLLRVLRVAGFRFRSSPLRQGLASTQRPSVARSLPTYSLGLLAISGGGSFMSRPIRFAAASALEMSPPW